MIFSLNISCLEALLKVSNKKLKEPGIVRRKIINPNKKHIKNVFEKVKKKNPEWMEENNKMVLEWGSSKETKKFYIYINYTPLKNTFTNF